MRRLAPLLLGAATVVVVFGFAKVHARYVADPPYDFTGSSRFGWTIAYVALLLLFGFALGLPGAVRSGPAALAAGAGAAGLAALGISVAQLVTGSALLPRFVVFAGALAVVPVAWLCHHLAAAQDGRAAGRQRVLVVGSPDETAALRADVERRVERPLSVPCTMTVEEAAGDGRTQPLVDEAARCASTILVLSRQAQADDRVVAQAAVLHEQGVRVRSLLGFYEEWLGKLPIGELERVSLLFDIGEVHESAYARLKRVADIVIAVAGVPFLLLAVPVVAVGNLVANRGPLLFRQDRVGKGGRVFAMWKFRTMRPGAGNGEWTRADDDRVTPFGRFLRRTHLDELPQVWNVLRGDLSIVGPRPEQPHYADELRRKLPFYDLRHLVRPGITGWAQVNYQYGASEGDALEKLQYEFFYLRHQSLRLDARIIGRTLRSVALGQGQ